MTPQRNPYSNPSGALMAVQMMPADRYLWTLPMFHANGWTYTWLVTAVGATHVCLRKVEPARIFALVNDERITMLCAAPTVLIAIANAPAELRRGVRPGGRVVTAGEGPPAGGLERVAGGAGARSSHG